MSYFGENIRFWRKQEGLSQEKFALKLGINRGKLATYEESVEPRQEFLLMLSKKFHVNLHDLLTKRMTEGTFDSFFLSSRASDHSMASARNRTSMLEKLMSIKSESSPAIRKRMVDEVVIAISQLMEENHDLREELLLLLKEMRK